MLAPVLIRCYTLHYTSYFGNICVFVTELHVGRALGWVQKTTGLRLAHPHHNYDITDNHEANYDDDCTIAYDDDDDDCV